VTLFFGTIFQLIFVGQLHHKPEGSIRKPESYTFKKVGRALDLHIHNFGGASHMDHPEL